MTSPLPRSFGSHPSAISSQGYLAARPLCDPGPGCPVPALKRGCHCLPRWSGWSHGCPSTCCWLQGQGLRGAQSHPRGSISSSILCVPLPACWWKLYPAHAAARWSQGFFSWPKHQWPLNTLQGKWKCDTGLSWAVGGKKPERLHWGHRSPFLYDWEGAFICLDLCSYHSEISGFAFPPKNTRDKGIHVTLQVANRTQLAAKLHLSSYATAKKSLLRVHSHKVSSRAFPLCVGSSTPPPSPCPHWNWSSSAPSSLLQLGEFHIAPVSANEEPELHIFGWRCLCLFPSCRFMGRVGVVFSTLPQFLRNKKLIRIVSCAWGLGTILALCGHGQLVIPRELWHCNENGEWGFPHKRAAHNGGIHSPPLQCFCCLSCLQYLGLRRPGERQLP